MLSVSQNAQPKPSGAVLRECEHQPCRAGDQRREQRIEERPRLLALSGMNVERVFAVNMDSQVCFARLVMRVDLDEDAIAHRVDDDLERLAQIVGCRALGSR